MRRPSKDTVSVMVSIHRGGIIAGHHVYTTVLLESYEYFRNMFGQVQRDPKPLTSCWDGFFAEPPPSESTGAAAAFTGSAGFLSHAIQMHQKMRTHMDTKAMPTRTRVPGSAFWKQFRENAARKATILGISLG